MKKKVVELNLKTLFADELLSWQRSAEHWTLAIRELQRLKDKHGWLCLPMLDDEARARDLIVTFSTNDVDSVVNEMFGSGSTKKLPKVRSKELYVEIGLQCYAILSMYNPSTCHFDKVVHNVNTATISMENDMTDTKPSNGAKATAAKTAGAKASGKASAKASSKASKATAKASKESKATAKPAKESKATSGATNPYKGKVLFLSNEAKLAGIREASTRGIVAHAIPVKGVKFETLTKNMAAQNITEPVLMSLLNKYINKRKMVGIK